MSMPNIPNVDSTISITNQEAINLVLASIAFEELGQAHIINAEAEKIQYVLGTLNCKSHTPPSIEDLLKVNNSVKNMLRTVIKNQILLQFKLEDTIEYAKHDDQCK